MERVKLYGEIFTNDYLVAELMLRGECFVAISDNDNGFENSIRLTNEDRIKLIEALGGNA